MSVLVVASTDGSRWIALLSDLLTSLVVLRRYRLCSYLGTPPGVSNEFGSLETLQTMVVFGNSTWSLVRLRLVG